MATASRRGEIMGAHTMRHSSGVTRPLSVAVALVLLAIALPRAASGQLTHVDGGTKWANTPVSNAVLDERVRDAAAQYLPYAPVARIVFFDVAFPKDSTEDVALNGYAVIVVTALVQDSSEVPLSAVYFHDASGELPLTLHAAIRSTVTDSTILGTFGRFRFDAVYLAPVSMFRKVGELLTDFAANRKSFRMGQFDGQVPEQVQQLPNMNGSASPPSGGPVSVILQREYPDLSRYLRPTH